MVFPLLRRQSGGKCQECSQSPVSTRITAERFYPDFENKILATRGEGLGQIVVLFLAGNHSLRFSSHEFQLLFSCMMVYDIRYFFPFITCHTYPFNFLLCIVETISLFLCIRHFHVGYTLSTQEIPSIHRYIHISNASRLFMSIPFRVHASILQCR